MSQNKQMRWREALAGCLVALLAQALPETAGASDFYAGKTISMSTHTGPGGGYDTYLRLLARHLGRHVPGKPNIVVVNQPGAGGLLSVNHTGRVAPQDGTWLTLVSQGLLLHEATGAPGLQVSLKAFNWLGNLSQSNNVIVTWHTSSIKTIADATTREVVVGATGAGSISTQVPALLNAILGTRFKTVAGYEGGAQINLAMQRGEMEGRGTNTWASYKATLPAEVKEGKLNVLAQIGLRKEPDLPQVPLLVDLVKDDPKKEAVARFLTLTLTIARPLAAPPGVPADRVAILRRAFDATMKDPEFLAEAEKLAAEIDPMTGEEVQDAVTQILTTPRDVIERTQAAIGVPAR
jgi:tripartite-type tricarboxylate transporter receptor subunit TctC